MPRNTKGFLFLLILIATAMFSIEAKIRKQKIH